VAPSARKVPAEVKSITVALARTTEQETVFQPGQETLVPIWKAGVEEALNTAAVFRDDSPTKVSVSVKILKIDVPGFGGEMTVTVAALYQVTDRASGNVLYSQRLETQGVVPLGFAFLGLARAREAFNRAVQANIASFVESVATMKTAL